MTIDKVLETRGKNYGDFGANVEAVGKIMGILNELHVEKTEAVLSDTDQAMLNYIVIKLVRLGATPSHIDSWVDLQGYGKLAEEYYSKPKQMTMDFTR